jgi:two-component system, chemotaxis family, protein-glutamate methylesterase/glutaminase
VTDIRILIVDDSAFARKVLRDLLQATPGMEVVGIARDGLDALAKIEELKPDVMTLDLVMPHLDGLGVLRALPRDHAPKVVVVCMADADSALALAALDAGAVDVVHKPTSLATQRLYDLSAELIFKVQAAAAAAAVPRDAVPAPGPLAPTRAYEGNFELLAIGASTGGPQALTRILKALPRDLPAPVAVVVHLPAGFTQSFADRLNGECLLNVIEATNGVRLVPGVVAIAPGGWHLRARRDADGLFGEVSAQPASLHCPSVDELFVSAAAAAPGRVLGVVLTGMGNDGTRGAEALHSRGSPVLVEAERSSVVYGMPRSVKEAGFAAAEHELEAMPSAILSRM